MPMPNLITGQAVNKKSTSNQNNTNPSTDSTEKFACRLASEHQATLPNPNQPLWLVERLPDLEETLQTVHRYFFQTAEEKLTNATAAEWLLDNNYIVQQAVRQVEKSLPPAYYKELPKLNNNQETHGFPRIYSVACSYILQEQCRIDMKQVENFLHDYQTVTPLTMGEVWAFPIMLRFCLLESLAQTAARIIPQPFELESLPPPLRFAPDIAENDIIANGIMSLRKLDSYDWQTFFETVSLVEQILRQDPARIYQQMTFKTRDQYRKVIEQLAQEAAAAEQDVAQTAVHLAESTAPPIQNGEGNLWAGLEQPPAAHVGAYLIGAQRPKLEQALGIHPQKTRRWLRDHVTAVYTGSIILLTMLLLALLLIFTVTSGGVWWQVLLVGLLGSIPVTAVAVSIVNWAATLLVRPQTLPRLDFSEGIPASCQTMVVVPTLLTNPAEIDSLLAQLEQHYLRNPDLHLTFALLTDFADAPRAEMPEDAELVQQAEAGVQLLNQRYPRQPFYLFHRRRLHNPGEGEWIGWERKRGKLHEFNRLLRGAKDTSYVVQSGDLTVLPHIRYVITLDTDTLLPPDAASHLVGTLAHPLNKARCHTKDGRIHSGYTILQPRTEIKPTSAGKSLFTRVFSGDVGLDLYSLAVSDVYQDLFGEGIYMGKGIYDVDAFEHSLADSVPENRLLSHDLFEGVQGRAGLVSDIVLYEDFPEHYLTHVLRSHRWIRGDWQLLPWLGRTVPTTTGPRRNNLTMLSRWKIADNLRRSLVAPTLFFFFIAGWLWLPGTPAAWTIIGLLLTAVSLVTAVVTALIRSADSTVWRTNRPLRNSATRWLLQITFLPYEALLNLDAIVTTLTRMFISRRHLLQWTTAARTNQLFGDEISTTRFAGQMIRALILVSLLSVILVFWQPQSLYAAAPLLILWLLAPEIARRISLPAAQERETAVLTPTEKQRLRSLSRRTWLFFEEFVGPEDNWLPPDHFQESPRGVVAHRTSPTNIGLYLLTALAAHDLGYISLLSLSLRLNDTFDTLDKLERHRGHFLNWLDTRTLQHLSPRYVSTVDSGNLAGCLLTLKQGCLAIKKQPVWSPQRWQGLLDTLSLFNEAIAALPVNEQVAAIGQQLTHLQTLIESAQDNPAQWGGLLSQLMEQELPELDRLLLLLFEKEANQLKVETVRQWRLFMDRLHANLVGMERELKLLMPWLLAMQQPPAYFTSGKAATAVQEAWQTLQNELPITPVMQELMPICRRAETSLETLLSTLPAAQTAAEVADAVEWCVQLRSSLVTVRLTVESLLTSYDLLAERANRYVAEMDFSFLYNTQRHVFHIGYNLENGRLDNNYYDLLASEARITSLVAIAKRDVPQQHWLHLARPLTRLPSGTALLSWSGTMFEYLMPPLIMRSYPDTLLAQSCQAIVDRQIAYGSENNVPWGISESGFYTFDNAQNYQYRAFGVPGTGLRRGLADDLVVSPYASFIALPVHPKAVLANLEHLLQYHMLGSYGLYEALDFTPSRLHLGQKAAAVRSYMSHHQGMLLLGVLNYLQDDRMVSRFHAEPAIQSVELLLQEQVPLDVPLQNLFEEDEPGGTLPLLPQQIAADPWPVAQETAVPLVHHLSNGRMHSLITNAGSGRLSTNDLALTRWRPDTTLDDWGVWLYVQDLQNGELWSATTQPTRTASQKQEIRFFPHKVQFRRHDHEIALQMEVTIAPGANAEIRLLHLINNGKETRHLRLTSYGEVVLTDAASDNRHQAFAKLFVESEYVPEHNALFFRRRPRAGTEAAKFMGHMLVAPSDMPLTRAFESDRDAFLGRNQTAARPDALTKRDKPLAGTVGATLDPVMSLGQEVDLVPHTAVELAWITFTANTRAELMALAEEYQHWVTIRRAFTNARTQSEQELYRLNLSVTELGEIQQLLSLLLYPHVLGRADTAVLAANNKGQPSLWGAGISGDYPILLLRMEDETDSDLLTLLLRAHTYWQRRGLMLDLVILNQEASNYGQAVHNNIYRLVRQLDSEHWLNKRGGIFILRADQMGQEDLTLLQTAARVVLDANSGPLAAQLAQLSVHTTQLPDLLPTLTTTEIAEQSPPLARPDDLLFDNGWGGFTADGREYVIHLEPGEVTPAPWINVIANEEFGFLISEAGSGYTWAENSGENRLTTWQNDPVSDPPAEALYLRDEETAEIWSPTPQPAPADAPYQIRHGAGYTTFTHHSHGIKQHLRLFTAPGAPVKIVHLRLENSSDQPRRLTATYFAEWVLGPDRAVSQSFIIPSYHTEYHALLARNPYNVEFGAAVAFLAANKEPHGFTGDRTEFLGRLGHFSKPAALSRIGLSDNTAVGADPCATIQLHIDLPVGGSEEIFFLLGQGEDEAQAHALIKRFKDEAAVAAAWEDVHQFWDGILGTITVETPEPAMNILLNRWLLYQALSCRIWGRSALYQSSGAYGFRDQLQDVMSVLHARPDLARAHLLRAARHQFEAGDVLHWWHPPSGRGVRTRITDDLVWLPYVTAVYVQTTGDTAVLNETVPYLTGEALASGEEERYGHYNHTEQAYSLHEHCCAALRRAATKGRHGLPLMGAGDWNDGMNRVGIEGEGESVWLGWFLATTLQAYAAICQQRGEPEQAEQFAQQALAYREAIAEHGWDGQWYRRAYFDNGSPLGSRQNKECRIDAIAQSWAVLSGLGEAERNQQAMTAVEELLINEEDRLLLLFAPPFDKTDKDPGYIKGYLPGIRENGGQYTHAALWTIWAFAEMGQGDKAEALFRLINPVLRADTNEKAARYKVEPYVISADVYGISPHEGRGGWTWYTGSSGWMYRLGIEGILGIRREGDYLQIRPCIPASWPTFKVIYCYGRTPYHITIQNRPEEAEGLWLDGEQVPEGKVLLEDNGRVHEVKNFPS